MTLSSPNLEIRALPKVTPAGVEYTGVAPDTDLRYRVMPAGIKEEVLLQSEHAPKEFRFHLADPKGVLGAARRQPDGSYRFDARIDSDVVIGLAAPFAYEERSSGSGDPAAHAPVSRDPKSAIMTVVPVKGGFDVRVGVDPNWLAGKRYPLVLDPTVEFSDANGAMFAGWNSYASQGCGGCHTLNRTSDLAAGTFTNPNYDHQPGRSFFRFDLSSIPQGSKVSGATLGLYTSACLGDDTDTTGTYYYCDDHDYWVALHQLDSYWNESNTFDQLAQITNPTAFTSYYQPRFNIYAPCTGCFWMYFNMTAQVQRWIDRSVPNNGFVAKLSPEPYNVGGPYWNYRGSMGWSYGNLPFLRVTYTSGPLPPVIKPDNRCQTTSPPFRRGIRDTGDQTVTVWNENFFYFRESTSFTWRRAAGYVDLCLYDMGWHLNYYGKNGGKPSQVTDWFDYVCDSFYGEPAGCFRLRPHHFISSSKTHYIENYDEIPRTETFYIPDQYLFKLRVTWSNDDAGVSYGHYPAGLGTYALLDF